LALALLLPAALALSALGPLLFLREAVFAPRTMVGMGALISACLALIATAGKIPRAARWALLGAPVYSMMMLAAVYGNAMRIQDRYEHRICFSLADDFAN
jgi:hypothetical protein